MTQGAGRPDTVKLEGEVVARYRIGQRPEAVVEVPMNTDSTRFDINAMEAVDTDPPRPTR